MLKFFKITAISALLLFAITACNDSVTANTEMAHKPLVYASFYPMYDLTQKAAGELADVRCLIPDGTEPHDWEPTPRDIAELEKADLFVYSSKYFETWADSVLAGVNNEKLMAVEASVSELYYDDDPHIWLSPLGAKRQFEEICRSLKLIDPENADEYAKNEDRLLKEFDKLDAEFSVLRGIPQNKILVTHAAFGHLCAAYGLEQIPIVDGSPDLEPDPARMAAIVSAARENGITTVFYEEISGARLAKSIANEIGGEIAPLSPLEGLTADQRENGDDYFSVMRRNLVTLKESLS